ncbi:MAG: hypothetical protein HYV28_04480 [Ignavibacteriales bacterium]|nr:hypothetical protein [Ignavibacteriales bacterium]
MVGAKVLGMISGYLFTVLIAKYYGVQILGNFSIALVFLNFFAILVVLGLDVAMVTYRGESGSENISAEKLFRFSFFTIIKSGVALLLLYYVFANSPLSQYLPANYQSGHLILLGVIPLGVIRLQANYYRRANRLVRFAFLNYTSTNTVAFILLILLGMVFKSASVIVISYVLAVFVTALFGVNALFFKPLAEGSESGENLRKKGIVKYSVPLMIYQLIENGYDWIVILVAGVYLPNEAVGIIALIIKLSSIFNFIDSGVNSAVLNKMSEYYFTSRFNELRALYKSSIKIIVVSNVLLAVAGIIFVPYLFKYLGTVFSEAVLPLLLVFLAKLFESYVSPLQSLLPVLQRQKALMKLYLVRSLILLVSLIIFIPFLGILGISIAICLTAVIYVLIVMVFVRYRVRFLALSTVD